jgi:hypothetical protein
MADEPKMERLSLDTLAPTQTVEPQETENLVVVGESIPNFLYFSGLRLEDLY